MTLLSLTMCIDAITKTIDSIAEYDDPQLSDEQRVLARLAIQHMAIAREDIEKLKKLLDERR